MTETYDVVIVGGGAAGLSAALVLTRARRKVVVVDAGNPRNAPAAHLHGFLSRDGLEPRELLRAGRAEIEGYGGEFVEDVVTRIRHDRSVELAGGSVLAARRVLVTTGLIDELPEIPGVRELWGSDVLHCPYCHGWEVRDQPIGVLGGSPLTMHQAQLIRQWSKDVTLFPHSMDLTGDDLANLRSRGVEVVPGKVERLLTEGHRLRGVRMTDGTEVPRSAVFVGPRFAPKDALLGSLGCARDENGQVRVDRFGRTSVPWVWAAGNAVDLSAQLISAAGDGSRAAMSINAELVHEGIYTAA
ncbi:NAD(P)/FAD-dependent oxidoreductase [Amycolatopsis palatopharyngis]|uniref:NAD(P)/FAD-dependent oxidoreductase n=1 Tax=Amycolatopsis palatopharyngis TaxID=187982 RepID=UPI000E24D89F|nr:NAD(P)/FAD-dependent oxidoreductase [Amycolatopsis palatopharyngis]